jgi:hypothetical protein
MTSNISGAEITYETPHQKIMLELTINKTMQIHLLFKIRSLENNSGRQYGILDKLLVRHEFRRRERGQRVQQEIHRTLEISNRDFVDAFVDFETIASVPVTAFVDEST